MWVGRYYVCGYVNGYHIDCVFTRPLLIMLPKPTAVRRSIKHMYASCDTIVVELTLSIQLTNLLMTIMACCLHILPKVQLI